ncbi:MAG: hemerythrin domain-containing protein [Candidatus Binatia bacterium]
MNAVEKLRADHRKVKKLFEDFASATTEAKKQSIAQTLFKELEVHALVEQEIFYPAVRAESDAEGEEVVHEALRQHESIASLIEELKSLEVGSSGFEEQFGQLRDEVDEHVEIEENEMFPGAQHDLGQELDTLGEVIDRRKEELEASG